MRFKVKGVLLASQVYSMVDEKTGALTEGVSIQYVTSEDLSPCEEDGLKGVRVAKDWLPITIDKKITLAPAIYEFTLVAKTNSKLKSTISVADLEFVSSFGKKA